jgi:hypothetical protein
VRGRGKGIRRRLNTAAALFRWRAGGDRIGRNRLAAFRNIHAGERCFILGNGPSLNETDLTQLRSEHTFALNRGYLKFDQLGFPPTFLVCINGHVLRQFGDELSSQDCLRFFSSTEAATLKQTPEQILLPTVHHPGFSRDPTRLGVHEGGTVTFAALQLAYFMGFREVILVGVDHRFASLGPANRLVTSAGPDKDHFDPEYYGPGTQWQLPDLLASEHSYRLARQVYEEDGRRIVDATVGGALAVFPKRRLEAIIP